ncbi:MAG: hypothetical protein JNM27_07600 [Leptospirales bacterium]|nr:hypothetical protein [Leptospirales bacterium]
MGKQVEETMNWTRIYLVYSAVLLLGLAYAAYTGFSVGGTLRNFMRGSGNSNSGSSHYSHK